MNKLKELLEKRASLLAEINELSKPGVRNLDADKRAAISVNIYLYGKFHCWAPPVSSS